MQYTSSPHNDVLNEVQRIRITDGCPWSCEWCQAPSRFRRYEIPNLTRKRVQILDMNLLAHPEADEILDLLPSGHEYELVCGVDYRFLTPERADRLHELKFTRMRFAWDGPFLLQADMKRTVLTLKRAGFVDLACFVICNHPSITFQENMLKLDLLKIWGVKICDCYYNGQVSPNFVEIAWSIAQMRRFRRVCRRHNQLVLFGIDVEYHVKNYKKPCLQRPLEAFITGKNKAGSPRS